MYSCGHDPLIRPRWRCVRCAEAEDICRTKVPVIHPHPPLLSQHHHISQNSQNDLELHRKLNLRHLISGTIHRFRD
ncbi:hypothetical protein HMPREF9057_01608 [Actinomyces sp. oral taxon 171 str. F0337]|nr:hypothetical protein HMPREF9057_01608 [Actinomyces sp. oral taxon 171 str. F0337]